MGYYVLRDKAVIDMQQRACVLSVTNKVCRLYFANLTSDIMEIF